MPWLQSSVPLGHVGEATVEDHEARIAYLRSFQPNAWHEDD